MKYFSITILLILIYFLLIHMIKKALLSKKTKSAYYVDENLFKNLYMLKTSSLEHIFSLLGTSNAQSSFLLKKYTNTYFRPNENYIINNDSKENLLDYLAFTKFLENDLPLITNVNLKFIINFLGIRNNFLSLSNKKVFQCYPSKS